MTPCYALAKLDFNTPPICVKTKCSMNQNVTPYCIYSVQIKSRLGRKFPDTEVNEIMSSER